MRKRGNMDNEIILTKMNKLIIGLTGSQGTGKTTLVDLIAKTYPNLVIKCTEGEREAAKALGIKNIQSLKAEQVQEFQSLILEQHLDDLNAFNASEKHIMICDRTVIDIFIYTFIANCQKDSCITEKFVNLVHELALKSNQMYTKIMYCGLIDIPQSALDDGFRDPDEEHRKYVDFLILKYLNNWKIQYEKLADDRNERFLKVQKVILAYCAENGKSLSN